jgi:cytidyltransferase-like protein
MRVMVDMSATLLHHGHIRLLRRAKEYGTVVVGLTSDEEVFGVKGYLPELPFNARKEILEALKYVDEVVETPWLITLDVLKAHNIDALFHGSDNSNKVPPEKLIIVPRTEGISSTELRARAVASMVSKKNRKAIFSAGPGALLPGNLLGLEPCFGRGDPGYQSLEKRVLTRLKQMTGHGRIVHLPGSASLALEVAVRNFVAGRVLVVRTGYYADRLIGYCQIAGRLGAVSHLDVAPLEAADNAGGRYDWVITVATETSAGLRNDIRFMRKLADDVGARLLVDATGSIGLEEGHELADVVGYSSCKGLFGLTGASFIAYNDDPQVQESSFYLDITAHSERKMTGPYHAICSLDQVLPRHGEFRETVRTGKRVFCERYGDRLMHPNDKQPLLCTLVRGIVRPLDDNVILYQPRTAAQGTSVVCHLGEGHLGSAATGAIYDRIMVVDDG